MSDVDSGNETSSDELEDNDIGFEAPDTPSSQDGVEADEIPIESNSRTPEEIMHMMNVTIRQVNNVVQLPQTVTRMLLNHFNWNTEKLYESYYEGDQAELFRKARVVNPSKIVKQVVSKKVELCNICCMDVPGPSMTSLDCGHRFCKDCWKHYFTTKIMQDGQCKTIACAQSNCDILVDDETVFTLIQDPKILKRYQNLIINSFVECNRLLRWCPKPDCDRILQVEMVGSQPFTCKCGTVTCFLCGEYWHEPVVCDLLKRWKKKCDDDSETSNWIAANTKECPRCQVTIEKDGGCNHMICKNLSCRADFCWVCLGSWEPHGSSWYNCNRYDEDEAKAARCAQERSRSALQRYLFYCNRYMNHMQSLKFENKLYETVKLKMEEMQQHDMSWIEVQFLKKAVDVLCQCRQTLMYTYVFAFYLVKNNHSLIFEANQKDLESSTEKLSEYLEREAPGGCIENIRSSVQDRTNYCEQRRLVLLKHVKEGYQNNFWEYKF